jgi:cell wall-associated NlpC family hydrolase
MKLLAAVLVALAVWFSLFSGSVAAKHYRRRHAQTAWTIRHHHRQHQRLTVVRAARSLLGAPYVFGGSSRGGVDCSGLTRYAYQAIGKILPHLASAQERLGRYVASRSLRPGDLLFYNDGGHAALYVGDGQMIEASSARGRVIRTSLREGWFVQNFDQARRLIG